MLLSTFFFSARFFTFLTYFKFLKIFYHVFVAALCNRAGHYIFAMWFLSSSFFFIFFIA